MDVSPTRTNDAYNQNNAAVASPRPSASPSPSVTRKTIVGATVCRENSKMSPKFDGEQQKVDAKTHLEAMPNSTRNPQPSTTPTKIPTNRSMNFKSNNLKSNMPAAGTFTPRAPGISRRSASTMSCRSVRSQKNDEHPHTLPPLPKVRSSAGDHESHNLSARERVAENNKLKVFQNLHKKLEDLQSDFMKKFENLKITSPDKLKEDYKFITMIRNNDCKLMVSEGDMQKVPNKLPIESVNDFKEKIKSAIDGCIMTLIENLNKDSERSLNLEEIHLKLQSEQGVMLNDLYERLNELCQKKDGEGDVQIVKMQREIQESKKALLTADKQMLDLKRAHSEQMQSLEKEFKERSDAEVLKKDSQIVELHKKLKQMGKEYEKLTNSVHQTTEEMTNEQAEHIKLLEELKACKDNIYSLNQKLNCTETELTNEKKENKEKLESLNKLESDLEAAKKKIDEDLSKTKSKTANQMHEQVKEIGTLKSCIETLERERHALECQVEKMKVDCSGLSQVHSQLKEAQDEIRALQTTLEGHAIKERNQPNPKEVHSELAKLRQSDTEKRREIEKLKVKLSKAYFSNCQLEEQIQREHLLLDVRSELIDSLQTNDHSQRVHVDEMFAQVADKNNIINEVGIKGELHSKTEEFRNLFATLNTKQMELSHQEHMIKLLEESNERSQRMRVKQEQKIGRLEEEIAYLRQTIHIYMGHSSSKNPLFAPVTPSNNEYNENFNYYTNERRRKM